MPGPASYNSATSTTVLTPAATVTLDASRGENFVLTPDQDTTINATNVTDQTVRLRLVIPEANSFIITFGTGFLGVPTLSTGITTGNATDPLIVFSGNGTALMQQGRPNNGVIGLTPGAAVSWDVSRGENFELVPAQDCTVTLSGAVAGKTVYLFITTSGVVSWNVTFDGCYHAGVLATGATDSVTYVVAFRGNSIPVMCEISRTGALT